MHLQGQHHEAEIYLIAHAAPQAQSFALPPLSGGRRWRRFVDTALEPDSVEPGTEAELANQTDYPVEAESVVVLVSS
jgi:hypothetical protein